MLSSVIGIFYRLSWTQGWDVNDYGPVEVAHETAGLHNLLPFIILPDWSLDISCSRLK